MEGTIEDSTIKSTPVILRSDLMLFVEDGWINAPYHHSLVHLARLELILLIDRTLNSVNKVSIL